MMHDRARVHVLPPLVPLVALVAGAVGHLAFPIAILSRPVANVAGGALLFLSLGFVMAAARELAMARTSFDVRRPTTALVQSGVFRVSRNPVYLSMMMLGFALALLANSLIMALLMVPAGSVLCLAVIRPEERYLEEKFGDRYRHYQEAVRRWL